MVHGVRHADALHFRLVKAASKGFRIEHGNIETFHRSSVLGEALLAAVDLHQQGGMGDAGAAQGGGEFNRELHRAGLRCGGSNTRSPAERLRNSSSLLLA